MNPLEARDIAGRALALATPAGFARHHFKWDPYPYQEKVMDAVLRQGVTRVAWVAGRRVGKTETIAMIALQLAVRKPGIRTAIFAPTWRQASNLSKRIKYMLQGSTFQRNVVVDNISELRLRFGVDAKGKPRESVIFANSMTGQVRGEGADVLIVDESAFCDGEDYRSKALPFVADRPNNIIIHISTVQAEDDHFMEELTRYDTMKPRGAVFRTRTAEKPGVTAEWLAECKASMREAEYEREYEARPVAEGSVFDRSLLGACLRDHQVVGMEGLARLQPRRHHNHYVGVDWGKKQDRAVIAAVEQGTQERHNPARLVFLQVYEPDPKNPDHYSRVIDHVQKVARQLDARRVVADEAEGGRQAEELRRALGGGRFRSFRFTPTSRNWLVENALLLVERRAVELPREPDDVRKAFANVQRTERGYKHASRKSKDVFDAIVLALLEVGDAGERQRAPMDLLAVKPGSGGVGLHGYGEPGPPVLGDPRKSWLPEEAWVYLS